MTQTLERLTADRLKIYKTSPELYEAMMVLSNAAAKDIDPELGELIKIRASQINHCAFCLDMHTRDARRHGVSGQKLDVIAAWQEAGGLFTERERAALALTVTRSRVWLWVIVPSCKHAGGPGQTRGRVCVSGRLRRTG